MTDGIKTGLQFLFSFYRRQPSDSNFGAEIGRSGDANQTYLWTSSKNIEIKDLVPGWILDTKLHKFLQELVYS